MLGSELITLVRAEVLHDTDTQFTDTQLYLVLGAEWLRLRRWLEGVVPSLCRFSGSFTVTSPATGILKSAITNFDKIEKVEKEVSSSIKYPLKSMPPGASGAMLVDECFSEEALSIDIYPSTQAPGTYTVTYLTANNGTVIAGTDVNVMTAAVSGVPLGLEQVMVHRTAAWARQRHDEAVVYHQLEAKNILDEYLAAHGNRNGQSTSHGMIFTRR